MEQLKLKKIKVPGGYHVTPEVPNEYHTILVTKDLGIECFTAISGNAWYKGYSVGQALGFTAGGRNLTRNVNGKWEGKFVLGLNYQVRDNGSIWFSSAGLMLVFSLVLSENEHRYRSAVRELLPKIAAYETRAEHWR